MSAVQKVLESEEKVSKRYSNFPRVQPWSVLLPGEYHVKERSFLLYFFSFSLVFSFLSIFLFFFLFCSFLFFCLELSNSNCVITMVYHCILCNKLLIFFQKKVVSKNYKYKVRELTCVVIRECGKSNYSQNRSQTYVSSIHGTATIRLRHNILSRMSDYELNITEEYVLLLLQVIIYVQNLAEISGSPA